jgi:hypothetical protein
LAREECEAKIVLISGKDRVLLEGAATIAKTRGLKLIATLSKPFKLTEIEAVLRKAKK